MIHQGVIVVDPSHFCGLFSEGTANDSIKLSLCIYLINVIFNIQCPIFVLIDVCQASLHYKLEYIDLFVYVFTEC